MISREQQEKTLRKLIVDELKIRTVKERMIAALRNKKQVATGNLESVIAKMNYNKAIKLKEIVYDGSTGAMVSVLVVFEFGYKGAEYAKYLDIAPYGDIKEPKRYSTTLQAFMVWAASKKPNYWIAGQPDLSSQSKLKKFAWIVKKRHFEKGGVISNKGRFMTFSRSNITTSINKAGEKFVDFWDREYALEIERQIIFN